MVSVIAAACGTTPGQSPGKAGPASPPVAAVLDACPAHELAFGPTAASEATRTVTRAVKTLYGGSHAVGFSTAGFKVTAAAPAASPSAGSLGSLVATVCGRQVQARTYVVDLLFPALLPSADLSQAHALVSRFIDGWKVWGTDPPGLQERLGAVAPIPPATLGATATATSTPPNSATGPIYLALGDSATIWNGDQSYPNQIAASYQHAVRGLELVNLGVSGETTTSMMGSGPDSQLNRAVQFLHAHQGSVALITIDIGGNDVLACGSQGSARQACVASTESTATANLTTILSQLRGAAGPKVPIVGMSYYDPYLGNWPGGAAGRQVATQSVTSLIQFNGLLEDAYARASAGFADVEGAFHSTDLHNLVASPWGRVPQAVDSACKMLDMTCRVGQPTIGTDPNAQGARAIALAFERAIGSLGLA